VQTTKRQYDIMFDPHNLDLPLIFQEGGYIKVHSNSQCNWGSIEGTLIIQGNQEPPTISVETRAGSLLEDAGFYAAYLAHRLGSNVTLIFDRRAIEVSDAMGDVEPLDEGEQQQVIERFKNIKGTGQLSTTEMLVIGLMVKSIVRYRETHLDKKPID
jgi:hypothetical protein